MAQNRTDTMEKFKKISPSAKFFIKPGQTSPMTGEGLWTVGLGGVHKTIGSTGGSYQAYPQGRGPNFILLAFG